MYALTVAMPVCVQTLVALTDRDDCRHEGIGPAADGGIHNLRAAAVAVAPAHKCNSECHDSVRGRMQPQKVCAVGDGSGECLPYVVS